MNTVFVDLGQHVGRMKPLHGLNNGPHTQVFSLDTSKYFAQAGIPFARLHDTEYPYGSGHFVDIPCVFPRFEADPDDPSSYDFTLTDEYIKAIHAAGTKAFYRLGVSIEHAPKKYHVFPPRDYDHWARICAGIVRHYNEGWADGLRLGIDYWEIWNEPENPPMWQGTPEQYYRLYVTVANYLKSSFPHLKIGGYAGSGFYALTRPNTSDFLQSFVPFYTGFLDHITAPATRAPLDFFSWHIYSDDVEEVATHAQYVSETLCRYGLSATENILNEWNYFGGDRPFEEMRAMPGAAFVAAAFCAMQNSPVDAAMYYDGQPASRYCGLFGFPTPAPTKTYYAFQAFNELYRLSHEVHSRSTMDHVYACAAAHLERAAILLCNYRGQNAAFQLDIAGCPSGATLEHHLLDRSHDLALTHTTRLSPGHPTHEVTLEANSVLLLKLAPAS